MISNSARTRSVTPARWADKIFRVFDVSETYKGLDSDDISSEILGGTDEGAPIIRLPNEIKTTSSLDEEARILMQLHEVKEQIDTGRTSPKEFAEIVNRIDWHSMSERVYEDAIRMALTMDASQIAHQLAQLGREIYPKSDFLNHMIAILAPPKIVMTNRPPVKGLSESMKWIQDHHVEYQGTWVAVQEGNLIGTASSRQALTGNLGDKLNNPNVIITRVS